MPSIHCSLGFHRLAINGVGDEQSNQPFFIDGIYLVCNGEIYNHKQILFCAEFLGTSEKN